MNRARESIHLLLGVSAIRQLGVWVRAYSSFFKNQLPKNYSHIVRGVAVVDSMPTYTSIRFCFRAHIMNMVQLEFGVPLVSTW